MLDEKIPDPRSRIALCLSGTSEKKSLSGISEKNNPLNHPNFYGRHANTQPSTNLRTFNIKAGMLGCLSLARTILAAIAALDFAKG
jgi:hypothetical protein